MGNFDKGQVVRSAAEVYEEFFVPALFQQWAVRLADSVGIQSGQKAIDIGCGTGILARELYSRMGGNGTVAGLDLNEGMLAVAKLKNPSIEWKQGSAEAIPFEDQCFDAAVSQFGLMFFEDKKKSIQEMIRMLRSEGHLAVAVWDKLENSPGYFAVVELLEKLFGSEISDLLRSPFALGEPSALMELFSGPDIKNVKIVTQEGSAKFSSIKDWMHTDVKGWTLADKLDDQQYGLLLREAEKTLQPFVTSQGRVEFPMPAHIVTATKI